jgi:hypothetical protein
MKKSIPGKTPKEAVSEKSGSGSGDNGFRGFRDGRFGANHPPGGKMCTVGRKRVYIFNRRMAKKLIPEQLGRRAPEQLQVENHRTNELGGQNS